MAAQSTLSTLAEGTAKALTQLRAVLSSDEAFSGVMLELGWDSATIPAPIAALSTPVDELATALGDGNISVDEIDDVLEAIQNLAQAITNLENQGASMPSELTADGFDQLIAKQLIDYLLVDYLEDHSPLTISLLTAIGLARESELDDEGNRPGSIQHSIVWEEIPNLLSDPRQLFVNAYGWSGDEFDHGLLIELLMNLGESLDLPVALVELSTEMRETLEAGSDEWSDFTAAALQLAFFESNDGETGVQLYGLPKVGSRGPGLAILPYGIGSPPASIAISDNFSFEFHTDTDLASGVAILLRPGEPIEILSGIAGVSPASGGEIRAELSYTGRASERTLLLGSSEGTRLQAAGVSIAAGAHPGADGDLFVEAALASGQLVISGADGGAFIAALLGEADRIIEMAPALGLSNQRGAYVRGGSRLSLILPMQLTLGPITIEDVIVEIIPTQDLVSVDVGAAVITTIGPFVVIVDKMGLAAKFSFPGSGGNLGPLDAHVAFLPPTTLLFSIDSEAVQGGGFIQIDPDLGRYSGGLALEIFSVGISAIVIVDTKVPGDGWALFASIGATFASPIPIGFGFTLIGVGGLIAVNRTIDVEGLAVGLKTGAADAILFPDDILADAAAVLSGLDQWFPAQQATTVFGPVVEIGWGNPTLISAQLGVVIALPDLIVALLGSIEMLLPTPDEAVLTLRMDILGAVDIPASEVVVAASLHDSNLLEVFELSGDMGFFARLSGQPLFLLSVGGYHPQFDPPGAIPGWIIDLRRTRAAIPLGVAVEIVLSSYVAITSNTVQFGGRFKLFASVKVLLTTYTAEGWFGINLLLVLKPFKLSARATAGVSISAGDRELFGIQLSARLEGPQEWYASGSAYFNFFGLDVEFGFEIGDKLGGQPRELHNVGADVARAMTPPGGWETTDVGDAWASGVVMTDQMPEGLWVRPDQTVEVRQTLAPLNRTITAYGEFIPSSDRIAAEDVTLGSLPVADPEWIEDWFAPAQFDRFDDTASLSSPSYELMTAGVRFGDAEAAISDDTAVECTSVSREPEESIFPDDQRAISGFVSPARAAAAASSSRTAIGQQITLEPTTYTVVRTVSGERAGSVLAEAGLGAKLSYADAVRVIDTRAAADPAERSRLRVAPSTAAMGIGSV